MNGLCWKNLQVKAMGEAMGQRQNGLQSQRGLENRQKKEVKPNGTMGRFLQRHQKACFWLEGALEMKKPFEETWLGEKAYELVQWLGMLSPHYSNQFIEYWIELHEKYVWR